MTTPWQGPDWKLWGPLQKSYEAKRPRRMLALDGGGIRGLITLQVLARIESLLKARSSKGSDFRLCDFFDYIGGTSTGAIIAASLARGLSVAEVLEFYKTFGRSVFAKRDLFQRWKSLYESGALEQQLRERFGDATDLRPENLRCLLLVVTRNVTTDSAWPISSNPDARYNAADRSDCNLQIPLWKIVRASTAAPVYFPPETIPWDKTDPAKTFVFVDGGTTPYNNPAWLMYRMATDPTYRLGWPKGEKDLLIVSVGTGSAPVEGVEATQPEMNLISNALATLSGMMSQVLVDQDVNCRTVGRCTFGDPIDREVGDLIPRDGDGMPTALSRDLGRAFLYARYNVEMTDRGLRDLGLTGIDAKKAARLDSIDNMDDLDRIGARLAERVKLDHFGPFA